MRQFVIKSKWKAYLTSKTVFQGCFNYCRLENALLGRYKDFINWANRLHFIFFLLLLLCSFKIGKRLHQDNQKKLIRDTTSTFMCRHPSLAANTSKNTTVDFHSLLLSCYNIKLWWQWCKLTVEYFGIYRMLILCFMLVASISMYSLQTLSTIPNRTWTSYF